MTVHLSFIFFAFAAGLTIGYFLRKEKDEETLKRIGNKIDKAIEDIKKTI